MVIAVQDEEEIYQVGVIRNERPTIAGRIGPPTYPNQPAVLVERRGLDLNSLDAVRHGHEEVIESWLDRNRCVVAAQQEPHGGDGCPGFAQMLDVGSEYWRGHLIGARSI
jgi:hypothetical protein